MLFVFVIIFDLYFIESLELVVDSEQNVSAVYVEAPCVSLVNTLIAEETDLCDESYVFGKVNLKTRLQTDLESVVVIQRLLVVVVSIAYCALDEEVNNLRATNGIAYVRSKLENLLTVLNACIA